MHWKLRNFLIDLKYYAHCLAVIIFALIEGVVEFAGLVYIAKLIGIV